jgi:hypothetical protein
VNTRGSRASSRSSTSGISTAWLAHLSAWLASEADVVPPENGTAEGPSWRALMERRISGGESGVPWNLVGKLGCREFCRVIGAPTVPLLAVLPSAREIKFDSLPETFVIKSSASSSGKATLVIGRSSSGGYVDLGRGTALRASELTNRVGAWLDGPPAPRRRLIVEERVPDVWGGVLPHDYKAYAFQGHVELVLEINRNHHPAEVTWYDGDFSPLAAGRVESREKFVTPVAREAPRFADALLHLARRVSHAVPSPFVSVDMYWSGRHALVGELTLTPGGLYYGEHYVVSRAQDLRMGQLWQAAEQQLTYLRSSTPA